MPAGCDAPPGPKSLPNPNSLEHEQNERAMFIITRSQLVILLVTFTHRGCACLAGVILQIFSYVQRVKRGREGFQGQTAGSSLAEALGLRIPFLIISSRGALSFITLSPVSTASDSKNYQLPHAMLADSTAPAFIVCSSTGKML